MLDTLSARIWRRYITKQQLVAVVIGAMLGFLMPYGAKVRGMVTRSRRMTSALKSELTEIVREMAEKIEWVERDVSRCLDEIDQSKVIRTKDGKMLFWEKMKHL